MKTVKEMALEKWGEESDHIKELLGADMTVPHADIRGLLKAAEDLIFAERDEQYVVLSKLRVLRATTSRSWKAIRQIAKGMEELI